MQVKDGMSEITLTVGPVPHAARGGREDGGEENRRGPGRGR